MAYTYRYMTNDDQPLERCPSCNNALTAPGSIELELVVGGLTSEHLTRLVNSYLEDTIDRAVANGYHSETRCRFCGIPLTDYEEEIES